MTVKILRPDAKGRISVGIARPGVIGYQRIDEPDGRITLIPMAAIPERELWLYQDKVALASVQRGIAQSKAGKLAKWKSFASGSEEE
ncbi:MAG TPA: hypothetical protein VGP72_08660 [Planctomycetota bacterium]|jgi:hypothetical protein